MFIVSIWLGLNEADFSCSIKVKYHKGWMCCFSCITVVLLRRQAKNAVGHLYQHQHPVEWGSDCAGSDPDERRTSAITGRWDIYPFSYFVDIYTQVRYLQVILKNKNRLNLGMLCDQDININSLSNIKC